MQIGFDDTRKLPFSLGRTKFANYRRKRGNVLPNNRKRIRISQHLPSAQMASAGQRQRFHADAPSGTDEKERKTPLLRKLELKILRQILADALDGVEGESLKNILQNLFVFLSELQI